MSALYISEMSAHRAGKHLVATRRAKSYRVKVKRRANPDRSVDIGYLLIVSR